MLEKLKFKLSPKQIVILIAIILLLIPLVKFPKVSTPLTGSKIDDWVFTPQTQVSSYSLRPQDIIDQLTYKNISLTIIFTFFLTLIPVNLVYLTFRILGGIARIFNKNLSFGTTKKIFKSLILLAIGVGTAMWGFRLGYTNNDYYIPFNWAQALVMIASGLVVFISLLYFLGTFFVFIFKKFTKKSTFGLKRKMMWSLSSILSIGVIWVWINLVTAFFGVDVLSLNVPQGGGGGINLSPGGQYSGLGSSGSSFGAIANPSLGSSGIGRGNFKTSDNVGFSTGGAKDINNFRENIKNSYFPISTDITYEGLYYDYYFDTGQVEVCRELFCPSYSWATSKDPISQKPEYYLSVGLNSGITKSDFARKKLNLVIVLDISGSMSSPFYSYYYDQYKKPKVEEDVEDVSKSKMKIANEAVVSLLDHLNPQDRFGMVLFDSTAYLAKPLRLVDETDIGILKNHILEILPQGSTNMEAGYKEGSSLFSDYLNSDKEEYENRIIFLTDAQPNTGNISESSLVGMAKTNADKGIYTTFIGIGVDFNTELIEAMTKIRGANYFSVHSSPEFKQRMDEGFDFMVTPLVFDLALKVNTSDFVIEKVYGSPEADTATGQIMNVNTLFPSDSKEEGVKGGIIILKLTKNESLTSNIVLNVSYKDRSGKEYVNSKSATFEKTDTDFYQNLGIRKGILLARYVNLLKNWINDERLASQNKTEVTPMVNEEEGIIIPNEILSPWERTSVRLTVSSQYKVLFENFENHFKSEMQSIGDESLTKEIGILDVLTK